MEHALPLRERAPWRTVAIIAAWIAALELLLLIVGGTVILGRSLTTHSAKAVVLSDGSAKAKKPVRHVILPRARTRVLVLNGNGLTGAAATEATAITARGYKVTSVGNSPRPTQGPSLVMYKPGFVAEAHRLARDAGIGIVTALDGLKTSSLHRAQLVIVVGSN